MKKKEYKIISVSLIREELSEEAYFYILDMMNGGATDCLIRWSLPESEETSDDPRDWLVAEYLVYKGAVLGETILIEIDY